jgi:PKD repeat protein
MRRLLAVPAAALLLAAPAQAIEFGGTHGLAYVPDQMRIAPGATVTWTGDFGTHPLRSAASAEPYSHDGTFGVTSSFEHAFAQPGIYRFYCAVHGALLGDNQVSGMSGEIVVTSNTPPVASFTATPDTVPVGRAVQFDASGSHDAEGPVTYAWDLDGDGHFDDGTGVTASRAYSDPGTVQVRLRVTDDNADAVGPESAVASAVVTVTDAAGTPTPTPAPSGSPTPAPSPSPVPGADTIAPRTRVVARRLTVVSRRIAVKLAADEPGRAKLTLRSHGHVLARGAGAVGARPRVIRLRLTAAGRKALRPHGRKVAATLVVGVRDAAGNRRTQRTPVTIRA